VINHIIKHNRLSKKNVRNCVLLQSSANSVKKTQKLCEGGVKEKGQYTFPKLSLHSSGARFFNRRRHFH